MEQNDKITIDGRKLMSGNKIILEAQANIQEYLILDNVIIILVKGDKLIDDRNIFGYDFNGTVKWQVPKPDLLHKRNYYTSIYLSHNNMLQAYSQSGVEITINKENGTILGKELIK